MAFTDKTAQQYIKDKAALGELEQPKKSSFLDKPGFIGARPEDIQCFNCDGTGKNHRGDDCNTCGGTGGLPKTNE